MNTGNAVLYGMNLRSRDVDVTLGEPLAAFPKDIYWLTAHGKNNLTSRCVHLYFLICLMCMHSVDGRTYKNLRKN